MASRDDVESSTGAGSPLFEEPIEQVPISDEEWKLMTEAAKEVRLNIYYNTDYVKVTHYVLNMKSLCKSFAHIG